MPGYTYRSEQNIARVGRGLIAIGLHPDDNDLETNASDIVADILHALNAAGVFEPNDPRPFLDRALRSYDGDFEDEPEEPRCECGQKLDANGEHDGGYGAFCG